MFENVEEGYPDGEKPVHYYYNRQHRLENAPESVKKYYNGEMNPVRGFKVLFKGPNKYILIALIFFVLTSWIYTGFNKSRNYLKIEGVDCEIQSYSFEEQIYTSISFKWNVKTKVSEKKDTHITARIYFIDADKQLVQKEIRETDLLKTADGFEYIRVKTTDYDIIRTDVILTVNDTEKELSTQVKR